MSIVGTLIFALCILVAFCAVVVWVCRRVRRGGGGATVGVLGATHELLAEDTRRAGEAIVQRNAGEEEEEDDSSAPPEPGAGR